VQRLLPKMSAALAALLPVLVAIATFVLQALLPGRTVQGYVLTERTAKPARSVYRLNGLAVCGTVVVGYIGTLALQPHLATVFAGHWAASAASSCLLGLVASLAFFVRGLLSKDDIPQGGRCATVDFAPAPTQADSAEFKVVCQR
jgi:hypothetical protein